MADQLCACGTAIRDGMCAWGHVQPDEPRLPLRHLDRSEAAKELHAAIPETRRLIESIERAKRVPRSVLDLEINI